MSTLLQHCAQRFLAIQASLLQILQDKEETPLTDRPDFDFWPSFINMVAVLALVVGLIILLGWLLRRFGGGRFGRLGSAELMSMVSSLPLGDKRFLAIVRVGKRYLLLGISGGEINNLGELEPEEVKQTLDSKSITAEEGGFAAIFKRMRGDKGDDA